MLDLSVALSLAMNTLREVGDAALLITFAYVVRAQSKAWNVRNGDRVFGPELAGLPDGAKALERIPQGGRALHT